jgi:aminodeoxyfutalosine deaminase
VTVSDDLSAFAAGLPKVELHLHLIGSAPPAAVARLAARAGDAIVPHDIEALRKFYEFRDFPHFLSVYKGVSGLVRGHEDFVTLVTSLARDLAAQNVRYAEVTVTPVMHVRSGLAPEVIAEGLDEGRRLALSSSGVQLSWCYDIPAREDAEAGMETVRIATQAPPEALVSIGLGGAEIGYPRSRYREAFDLAISAGLRSVPHAGEADGADSVWQAVRDLRAERIGHGISAAADPALLEHLVAQGIALEVCPVSNIRTRVVESFELHPLRRLLDAGVPVTLSSDDPPMFGTTVTNEYIVAGSLLGLSTTELAEVARNGVRAAFLDEPAKRALLSDIDAYVTAEDSTVRP